MSLLNAIPNDSAIDLYDFRMNLQMDGIWFVIAVTHLNKFRRIQTSDVLIGLV